MSSYSPRFPNAPSQYDPVNESQFRAALRQALQDSTSPLAGTLDLNDLDDVNVPGPSDDDVLMWSTDRWVAFALLTEDLTFEGNLTFNGTTTFVGDVTAANVDFSGNVTFTGSTTVPEATVTDHEAALAIAFTQLTGSIAAGQVPEAVVTQHEAALAIAFSQLTGSIAAGQVPEAVVTQHEAALAIAASQVTAGTFGSGDFTFPANLSVTGRVRVGDGTHDLPTLAFSSDTDLGFYKATTGGMGLSAEFFALNSQSATGSPYISWRQNGTERAYIQWNDSATRLRFSASEAGASMDWLIAGTIAMQYKNNDLTNVLGDVVATN